MSLRSVPRMVAPVALAGMVGVALLAGCSRSDDAAPASESSATTAGGVATTGTQAPGTTAKAGGPSTTRPPASSTTRPSSSSTVGPSTTKAPATTSTTARPATSTTAKPATTSTAKPATATCADVGFGGPGGNQATGITAAGVGCGDATTLVREVAASHNFSDGPRTFSSGGYSCTVVTDQSGLPKGFYSCSSGGSLVAWTKT